MNVEILFSEVCNLFGDIGNIRFLEKCLGKKCFTYTSLLDEPRFVKEDVDFIYMGPMSENIEEKVIKKLMPHKKRIKELINKGTVFLFTGNALEILGKSIKNEDGTIVDCLDILNLTSKRDRENRYSSLILGRFGDIDIVGYKSQFSSSVITTQEFLKNVKEQNNNTKEGVHINNFFGTNILGPILVLNPYFTKYLLNIIGYDKELPFEKELVEAYNQRLMESKKENTKY